ncbi:single-pass membrane and coiled-coil domain-containing protein 3-like isoform X1 [Triplophysa dalaica]|uniref:single-pass membrane and coiled-coil domain-containing protein 3-like isoform X1 n=1 Tax=Triplophysa dalaica TaxID=1582913 RepID=UPI0024DFCFC1|nr:single-pass membrane and coiled-coil domain-containing protein 3-like isoform X1 [Triplophysa dalaica]
MSWSDIFYPGNPQRREDLIRRSQDLRNLMESNFRATNRLIDVLNEHLGYSFSKITLDEKADVKHNCDTIIGCMREIQAAVEKIDKKLKDKLEPHLYEKLKKFDLKSLSAFDHSNIASIVLGVTGAGTTAVVCSLMKCGTILENIVLKHGLLKSSIVAGVVIGVVFLGIDMIIGAIMGSYERNQLEDALKEYDRVLKEFKPASEKYQDSIFEVMAEIKMIKKS